MVEVYGSIVIAMTATMAAAFGKEGGLGRLG